MARGGRGPHAPRLSCDPGVLRPIVFPSAPEAEYRAAFDGTGADVVACGHIHLPYVRRIGDSLVLNPGSVGLGYDHEADEASLHFDPWAAWAVVSVGSGRFSVELRRTPFDPEAVAAAHRASGMPYGEEYAGSWSHGLRPRNTSTEPRNTRSP